MRVRKANEGDLEQIMAIYAHARTYMEQTGNPNQWGPTNWPPEQLIRDDIARGKCYVCVLDGGLDGERRTAMRTNFDGRESASATEGDAVAFADFKESHACAQDAVGCEEAARPSEVARGESRTRLQDIVGVFYFDMGVDIEPTYRHIEEGAWMEDSPYGVVHRIASSGTVKGVGAACINWAFAQCGHMRIDTHGDNLVMQRLLKKLGFTYCGVIYVEEDDYPRLAYEKV